MNRNMERKNTLSLIVIGICMLVIIFLNSFLISKINIIIGQIIDFMKQKMYLEIHNILKYLLILLTAFFILDILQSLITKFFLEIYSALIKINNFNKILYLNPLHFQLSNERNYFTNVFLNVIENYCNCMTTFFTWHLVLILNGIVALVSLFKINHVCTLALLIIFPTFSIFFSRIANRIADSQTKIYKEQKEQINFVYSILKNIFKIRNLKIENFMLYKYKKYLELIFMSQKRSNLSDAFLSILSYLQKCSIAITLFLIGFFAIKNNILTIGEFVSFIILANIVRNPIELSGEIIKNLRLIKMNRDEINNSFSFSKIAQEVSNLLVYDQNSKYCIEMKNVENRIKDKLILKNICIKLETNKSVGVFGESGSGKTTLLKVLTKNLPYNGQILVLDNELKDLSFEQVSNLMAVSFQHSSFFPGTLKQNIVNKHSNLNKMSNYTEKSSLFYFLKNYNLEGEINNYNEQFSGGEMQRLSLLSTFITEKKIILLDEPTASLDLENEIMVTLEINKLKQEKIILTTSHKKTTLCSLDYLYGIKDGEIIEEGSPYELCTKKNSYFNKIFAN